MTYLKYLRTDHSSGFKARADSKGVIPKVVPNLVTILVGAIFISVPRLVDTALGEILGVSVLFVGLVVLFVTSVILSRPLTSLGGLSGLLIALLGVLLALNPAVGVTVAGALMGMLLVFQGVMEVRVGSSNLSTNVARALTAVGVLSVIGGSLFLLFPMLSLSTLTMAVGIWIVVASVLRLSYGVWVHMRNQ